MRYVIYGAGAIGGTIGGLLQDADHDVALIARGEHLEQLRRSGLRLQRPDADQTYRIAAYAAPQEAAISSDDVVVMAMKTQHTLAALDALAEIAPHDVTVVCAQNGVENERLALRRFPRTYAMCVMLPADHLEPGVVRAYGSPRAGILDVGRYPFGVDETAQRIANDLEGSGFSAEAIEEPMRIKYGKLLINLHSALQALGGDAAQKSGLATKARQEANVVLEAAGIPVATPEEDARRREGVMAHAEVGGKPRDGGSSWQSLARGTGSIETDYLNGEIVLLGRLHGIPTPINEGLQHLARWAATRRIEPGELSVAELEERVLADSIDGQ